MGRAILVAGCVYACTAAAVIGIVVIIVVVIVVIVVVVIVVIVGVGATVRHWTAVQAPVRAVAGHGVAPSGSVGGCA
jgi:hypothetical protein